MIGLQSFHRQSQSPRLSRAISANVSLQEIAGDPEAAFFITQASLALHIGYSPHWPKLLPALPG